MSEKNVKFYLRQGNQHQRNSEIDMAIQSYLEAIRLDPSFDKPYKCLRNIQKLNEKQRNIIADCYTKVIEMQSELPVCAYVQLGDILTKRGEFEEAIKYYQQSTEALTRTTRPEFYEKSWDSNKVSKPNFIIIGAAKAGTTSLFQYLIQHPQVLSPIKKEVGFFHNNQSYSAGVNWYLSHFPNIPENSGFITGEATPNYLVSNVQFEVAKLLPQVKLIAILRDPVERAISHYHHRVKHRWENRSLEEAITAELVAVKDQEKDSSSIEEACRQAGSVYLLGGLYYYTLKRWMSIFPAEQFLILENTELLTKPNDAMQKVYSFLRLPEYNISEYKKRNVGSYQKEDLSLIENKLYQFFHGHNKKLESFLNISFNWKKSQENIESKKSYQSRDFNIVDYQLWSLKDEKRDKVHTLRGPQPSSLIKSNYFTCLGPATTFGCYTELPYPFILQNQLSLQCLNLGIGGAGANLYLQEENSLLIDLVNDSKFVVILVMSGRSHASKLFQPPKVGKLTGPKIMKKYKQLYQADKALFREAVNQMRESFVNDYIRLSEKIKVPKILLYLSTRSPKFEDDFSKSFSRSHRGFPHFINKSTIQNILPFFDEYVECVLSRGFPQKLISRFTGEPTTNSKGESQNGYYASPEMHQDAAQMLIKICQKYLSQD